MSTPHTPPVFRKTLRIPASAIDGNGHANNVAYIQWMQDIAVEHYESLGGIATQKSAGGTWFIRGHRVEYLLPAAADEEIEILTWVDNLQRVRSLRKYEFARKADGKILVKGETDWVFVDAQSGKPMAIPLEVRDVFQSPIP